MKPMNLIKSLKSYKNKWVAIDQKSLKVVAQARDFASLSKKIESRQNIFLMPAAEDYFGFIT